MTRYRILKTMTSIALLISAMLVLSACRHTGEQVMAEGPTEPTLGQPAPDFTLKTIEGTPVTLSDLSDEGPVVLLVLRGYIGKQCPICNIQVGQYLSEAQAFVEHGAKVIMVYPGPAEGLVGHAEDFVSGKGLPDHFVFLLDPDLTFTKQYDLRWEGENKTAYPATFVIDKGDRVIRHAQISNNARGRTTPGEVLEVLDGPK